MKAEFGSRNAERKGKGLKAEGGMLESGDRKAEFRRQMTDIRGRKHGIWFQVLGFGFQGKEEIG